MQMSNFNIWEKEKKTKIIFLTKAARVNSFVDWVNCANDDDCNLILFDVVLWRFVVNVIKYSRVFATKFNWLLNSINADWLNGIVA